MQGLRASIVLVVAVVGAACAGGSANPGSSGDGATPSVATADSGLGRVLTDAQGRTLYVFLPDDAGQSTCTGECAQTWPPALANGRVVAGSGVDRSMLSTQARPDGSEQLTYNGWPLYRYGGDSAPGQTNGQGIGGSWFVMDPDGSAIRENSAGGSGYGDGDRGGYG
jgi:predicted lipoprotein with Yx(FWY)xxD motif